MNLRFTRPIWCLGAAVALNLLAGEASAQNAPPGFFVEDAFPGVSFDLPDFLAHLIN